MPRMPHDRRGGRPFLIPILSLWRNEEVDNVEMNKLLPVGEVLALTGIGRSNLYLLVGRGLFPRPVQITKRRVGWRAASVVQWIEARPQAGGVAHK